MASLAREFPGLATFSTLSPVPGFRAWLLALLAKVRGSPPSLCCKDGYEATIVL